MVQQRDLIEIHHIYPQKTAKCIELQQLGHDGQQHAQGQEEGSLSTHHDSPHDEFGA